MISFLLMLILIGRSMGGNLLGFVATSVLEGIVLIVLLKTAPWTQLM